MQEALETALKGMDEPTLEDIKAALEHLLGMAPAILEEVKNLCPTCGRRR